MAPPASPARLRTAATAAPSSSLATRTAASLLFPLLLLLSRPDSASAILPTAAIDVYLPDTSDPITLLASEAGFGGSVARYDDRHALFSEAGNSGRSRVDGVGAVPSFPPEGDEYLCGEADGTADYSESKSDLNTAKKYYRSAMLVPRGRCSFERKALSAQRLGASAVVVYGTMSSRYGLNVTNSTADCESAECDDAETRSDYTNEDVIWPKNKVDYDCDLGKAWLPAAARESLDFVKVPGGYNEQNDEMLEGRTENNLCVKYDASSGGDDGGKSFVSACESQRCLVTGNNVTSSDGAAKFEACCAWDLHVFLYGDYSLRPPKKQKEETEGGNDESAAAEEELEAVTIPAVFVTMRQSSELLDVIRGASDSGGDPVVLSVYARYTPKWNASAVLIWAFGVFVAWFASYHSSKDIRKVGKMIVMQRKLSAAEASAGGGGNDLVDDGRRGGSRAAARARSRSSSPATAPPSSPSPPNGAVEMGAPSGDAASASAEGGEERTIYDAPSASSTREAQAIASRHVAPPSEESLELTPLHAVAFLVMASCSLLVLFFLKIYGVVKVMYAFGCSGAFAQVAVHPAFTALCRRFRWDRPRKPVAWLSEECATREAMRGGIQGHCLTCLWSMFGPVSPLDAASVVVSYGIGAVWLWVAFTIPHPDTIAFYWIVQDVFGLCMCTLFLETIKLNALRVGAILLIVAFFYDIFFVFVTPLLTRHGESIMVNVATSGGPPKADPSWCEKYPGDADCKGGDPLPMLFAIPRIGDYRGGCSMLGLGDIVLPGLLLSFASRYDESKRLLGFVAGGSGRAANVACPPGSALGGRKPSGGLAGLFCCCRNGYYGPVMVGYAVGLAMANAAVYLMQMGQPALLYLVPCCLGTMAVLARRAGEWGDLWEGPRAIRAADAILYGEGHVESAAADAGLDEEDDLRRALDESREEDELRRAFAEEGEAEMT